MSDVDLKRTALDYHEMDPPGKIAIQATKPVANQHDLALAYSPGVAHEAWRSRTTPRTSCATPRAATW